VNFRCEDLPKHGLVLVHPASKDYDPLLSDIQRRLANPVDGSPPLPVQFRPRIVPEERPTSAILLNRSSKAIAGLQVVWRFETETGRSYRNSQGILSPQGLLLRFAGPNDAQLKLYGYWHTIPPGSKRYLGESGMVGDNTDVRPPTEEEKWRGGIVTGGGSGGMNSREPIRQVTLVLDGIFFLDGEFVGPNGERLYEQTVADAEAHLILARIAKEGHNKGLPPAKILAEIQRATGPAPERPSMDLAFRNAGASQEDFRRAALQTLAFQLSPSRRFPKTPNDEQTVFTVMAWADTVLPHLRKSD
jgi:hypothetical protein